MENISTRIVLVLYVFVVLFAFQGGSSDPSHDNSDNSKPATCVDSSDAASEGSSQDEEYFSLYSQSDIHRRMLSDQVRMKTYKDTILGHRHIFQDRVVLDVGCGTGILSLWALRAGARHVICLEATTLVFTAEKMIASNGYNSSYTTFIHSKAEDATLPLQYVDIILWELMGVGLVAEDALQILTTARDRWLNPAHGVMIPHKMRLYLGASSHTAAMIQSYKHQWEGIDGFNMSLMHCVDLQTAYDSAHGSEASVIPGESVLSRTSDVYNRATLVEYDLMGMASDVSMNKVQSTVTLDVVKDGYLSDFFLYFVVDMVPGFSLQLSTSPLQPPTHWKQLSLPLPHRRRPRPRCSLDDAFFTVRAREEVNAHVQITAERLSIAVNMSWSVECTGQYGCGEEQSFAWD